MSAPAIAFPPRAAGRVLDAAMQAALAAATAEAERRQGSMRAPWGGFAADASLEAQHIMQAAIGAAAPHLAKLTSDPRMIETIAYGMAEEALIQLRKSGAVP